MSSNFILRLYCFRFRNNHVSLFLLQIWICKTSCLDISGCDSTQALVGNHFWIWNFGNDLPVRMVRSKCVQLSRLESLGQNLLRNLHVSFDRFKAADVGSSPTDVLERLQYRELFICIKGFLSLKNYFQLTFVCAVFGLSNFIGLFLTLSIEIPVSSVCKLVLLKSEKSERNREIPMNLTNQNTRVGNN